MAEPTENQMVFYCSCGQKLSAPSRASGLTVNCPKCGEPIVIPAQPADGPATDQPDAPTETVVGRLCTVCQTAIGHGEPAQICPGCRSPFHKQCWDQVGGCATYGCKFMPAGEPQPTGSPRRAGWGDVKECPNCHKEILSVAVKCRLCGARFPSPTPMTGAEYHEWRIMQAELSPAKTMALVMFIASLIGFLAPVILMAGGIWLWRSRKTLRRVGGVFEVLAYGAVVLSALYSVIIVFAFVI